MATWADVLGVVQSTFAKNIRSQSEKSVAISCPFIFGRNLGVKLTAKYPGVLIRQLDDNLVQVVAEF